jgi:ABC-type polysaccharide/polyol phosphate transport system ATPase subunit
MDSKVKFTNVYLEFNQITNIENSIKENFIKFFLNFGQKIYRKSSFTILNDINFELHKGDRLAIIGKNGAGKSSLLRTICKIYTPQKGIVEVEGRITSLIELGLGFNPELTGRENIYINAILFGFSYDEIKAKEQEIIDFADLGEFIDTQIKYYSTGMNMKLCFSVATIIEPKILVIDELFAGGDIGFIEKSSRKLIELKDKADIFIVSPHDMSYVKKYCNKVLYLKDRMIDYFGSDIDYGVSKYIVDMKI